MFENAPTSTWGAIIYTLMFTAAWLLSRGIVKWFSKKCRWSHQKKYISIHLTTNWTCPSISHPRHDEKQWWATRASWICEREGCNAFGDDCFGTEGWWKIEFGKVVLDEKKMADPPKDVKSPAQQAAQKAQERASKKAAPAAGDRILDMLREMQNADLKRQEELLDFFEKKIGEMKGGDGVF